jgi:tRNA-splicing ligase RtcB
MEKSDIKRISEYIWEISQSYRQDMRVPARIFISEKMLEDAFRDESLNQAVNVAAMPGIYKYSLAMPDLHEGYGFCIGGVAAFDPAGGGVISPGGVGFDINCIYPEATISLPFGANLKIKDFVDKKGADIILLNKSKKQLEKTEVISWQSRLEKNCLYSLESKFGFCLKLTADHPIYNGRQMVKAGLLKSDDKIVVNPFSGVGYEDPIDLELINPEKIINALEKLGLSNKGNRYTQILKWFKERNFLDLNLNSWQTPYLIKIMGLLFGDGTMNLVGRNSKKGLMSFYGKEEDLKDLRNDLAAIGIKAAIYKRVRIHSVKNHYGKIYKFTFTEYSLHISSTGFTLLMHLLGAPVGNKTDQEFLMPKWLKRAPLWHKRLFLSAFFGAEMSKPATMNKYNFYQPTLNINKIIPLKRNGFLFLEQLRQTLSSFGVKSTNVVEVEGLSNPGKTIGLRFQIYGNSQNLIRFFGTVGFEYHREKQQLANLAIAYLQYKEKILDLRKRTRKLVRQLYRQGVKYQEIAAKHAGLYAEPQFIQHSIWTKKRDEPRIAFSFPSFDEFIKNQSYGLGGLVVDEIESIVKEPYVGPVYDVTVNHSDHNFIANNIVVSNCGVRLIKTPHNYSEIKDKISDLATQIYNEVPSGVGRGGRLKLSNSELDEVLRQGVVKMIESGYATEDDTEHCEANGRLADADPNLVSKTAKDRGRDQIGTIGSGNHFVEVQRVDVIYDKEAAKALGLFDNQITIMIHCGSRGLGHQVATDYIKTSLTAMQKYGIKVPDVQLACAPFNSPEGQNYWKAMSAAANFAWANRQFITWEVREAWRKVFNATSDKVNEELKLVYDVAHNLAKLEEYDGKKLIIHRKGATRSFPGQPVLIPGSMGTASFVLVGAPGAMELSFGSSCHGAGRMMSRTKAKREVRGSVLKQELEKQGIAVRSGSMSGLAEEAPIAYKDVEEVVDVVHGAGLARKVARARPVAVIKG